MPKLILHAGLHKTGTTAIQAFAHKNRDALKKKGFLYPDYSPILGKQYEAHHDFAHAIAGQGKRLSQTQVQHLAAQWAKSAEDEGLTVFFSSESISRHLDEETFGNWSERRKTYLQNLANILAVFDITLIVVLRRQDDYAKSLFQEHVMKNSPSGRQPFSAFRKNFEKNKIQRRFYQNLLVFEAVFPQIQVLIYEDLIKDGQLCANFFAHLGIDTRHMTQVGIVRKSLSPRETMLKIFLNHAIVSKKQNREVLIWIRSPEVQNLLDKYYGNENFDLWKNFQSREDFLTRFAKDNEQIRKRYFPNRQHPLFLKLLKTTISEVPILPEPLKAEMAIRAFLLNSSYSYGKFKNRYLDKFLNLLKKRIN